MDDDVNLRKELNKLIDKYNKNKDRIVGNGENIEGYNFTDRFNDVDIVLTKLLIYNKN